MATEADKIAISKIVKYIVLYAIWRNCAQNRRNAEDILLLGSFHTPAMIV